MDTRGRFFCYTKMRIGNGSQRGFRFFFANKEIFPIILRNQNLVIAASIAILVYV